MNNKKVGILTFHRADNLGAVLQAFALHNAIEANCGVSAEIIDYKCSAVENTRYVKFYGSLKNRVKTLAMKVYYFIKRRGFDNFRKEKLKISSDVFNIVNIKNCYENYDAFVTGSDQVWNLSCSGNDMTYFLDFIPDYKKKISYAASIGNYEYSLLEKENIKNLLKDFYSISVRENSAKTLLDEIGVSNVSVLPDPVFLLDDFEWQNIMSKRLFNKKYVFVYLIQEDVNVLNSALRYAKANNCKIINNKKSIEFIMHNSPAEFLSWIFYADCVFTNSFHGTAFSLIFNKPLKADIELRNGGINNRVNELLITAHCEDCILNNNDFSLTYPKADDYLSKIKKDGIKYLIDNLREE